MNSDESTEGTERTREPWPVRLFMRACPHWWWPVPDEILPISYDVERMERCRICGKRRMWVGEMADLHPSRDRAEVLDGMSITEMEVLDAHDE